MAAHFLRGPLSKSAIHLCLDMQRIFDRNGPWATPWMSRVLPTIERLASRVPDQTIFTRFVTPSTPAEMPGMWQRYYERWRMTTREVMDPALLNLVDPLAKLVPPATVIDKTRYSAFCLTSLHRILQQRQIDTIIFTGSETDVCVLSTVMDAVDLGYRSVIVRDGICSSSNDCHDSMMKIYEERFTEQVETANGDDIICAWQ
jgi:nicotinamidase-related amidase